MNTVAKVYAESLFDLAKEENAVETYQQDMLKVQEVFQDQSFVQFFCHVGINDENKNDVMKKAFLGQVQEYVYNFLLLLIKKRRMNDILSICDQFQSLCYEYLGIEVGKVYSAYPMNDEDIEKIEVAMSQKEKKKVKLNLVIDENLIGGIKVEIRNHVYDDSLSYKLESLRQELLRK